LVQKIDILDGELVKLKSEVGSGIKEKDVLIDTLNTKNKKLSKQVETKQIGIDEIQLKLVEIQKKYKTLADKLKALEKAEAQIIALTGNVKKAEQSYANSKKEIDAQKLSIKESDKLIKSLQTELAKKPKEVIKEIEVIREVPVEVIKEVEVVKSLDINALQEMLATAGTVEVSKKVVGERRIVGKAKTIKKQATQVKSTKTKTKTVKSSKPKAKTVKPKKSVAVKARKDDLKKIEGVGPKIAKLLNNDGIITFAQLSKAKITRLKKILDAAGPRYQMHNPQTWPEQASLAAKAKWDDLSKLQDKLKGGRK